MIFKKLYALWHDECYHGWGRSKRFFEGWYYKLVSEDQGQAIAIIPGIAMDETGSKQAFIQVLDGKKDKAWYHRFDANDFRPSPKKHSLFIGNNFFSSSKMTLELPNIQGEVNFDNLTPWSSSLLSPGIMGPFSFVPFMECYHGILSMNHSITGEVVFNNESISFSQGKGYMEKDWGHSFPEAYIWMQSNHFSQPGTSVKASIAMIPWLTSSFIGHIGGLLFEGKLYEFTTYNGSRIKKCKVMEEKVEIIIENGKFRLSLWVKRNNVTELAAPIAGFMDARIEESMKAEITVELFDKKTKTLLLSDVGFSGGIEVAGKYQKLIK